VERPGLRVLSLVGDCAVLTEPDEVSDNSILSRIDGFSAGNPQKFLPGAGFFRNRATGPSDEVAQAGFVQLLNFTDWNEFSLPN